MTRKPMADAYDDLKAAAEHVMRGFKETPGGDAYVYRGSMNNVEWLRDTLNRIEAEQMEGEP